MVEWLERSDLDSEDGPTALWGYYKKTYPLKDLEKWLYGKQKQREAQTDQKGKKKATDKRGDDGDDSTSSPPLLKNPIRSQ
jgi:hypothetical protein